MARSLSYLVTGYRLGLKSWASYKIDFTVSVLSAAFHDGATLVFLAAVFANIRQLQGWSFEELLFLWGFAVFSRNLMTAFFDVISYSHGMIRSGDLDRLLVRPQGLLVQIASMTGLNIFAIGRAAVGGAVMLVTAPVVGLAWWAWLYFPVAVAGSILLLLGLQLSFVCINFWVVEAGPLLGAVIWTSQFGQYPTGILAPPLQFVFTWLIPYALAGFFPAAFLMRGQEYLFWGLIQPLWGLGFFGLALWLWNRGLARYQGTGS